MNTQGHYADKCNQGARCGVKAHVEDLEHCKHATKCVNSPKNDRNKHGSLENPARVKSNTVKSSKGSAMAMSMNQELLQMHGMRMAT